MPCLSPPIRALQYVASKNTYGKACSPRSRVLNTIMSLSRSAQILETSLLEIPDWAHNALTRSSTLRVETPWT